MDEYPQFRRCQLGAGVIFEHANAPNTTICDLTPRGSEIDIKQETCAFQMPAFSAFARYGKAWPFIPPGGRILAFVSVGSVSTSGILTFQRQVINWRSGSRYCNDTFLISKQASCPTEIGVDYRWTVTSADPDAHAAHPPPVSTYREAGGLLQTTEPC